MKIGYDVLADTFLEKITDYSFLALPSDNREAIIDGYMKMAVSAFKKNCRYDLFSTADDEHREFNVEIAPGDIDELVDIVSDGMIVQWLKPYVYKQELIENTLSTRDYTTYSPAELLKRVTDAYAKAQKDYKQDIREYSYNTGALGELHL